MQLGLGRENRPNDDDDDGRDGCDGCDDYSISFYSEQSKLPRRDVKLAGTHYQHRNAAAVAAVDAAAAAHFLCSFPCL